ncbi:hypothetical protein TGME49_267120 [Toxoplasma gondii ME49]|uniref:Uncharacterized protein n=4 Tax=Toxoplasma gondii TaxID=5811 RepID=A0A125YGG7_TOXGV|nr:hypothetical protein TGME49_267120 [Toxoplasma gondii ME49]EPT27602.1 hypothetical protein TGME49_267120 [Toxoplasma gondii ME49]ESS33476.1 hypothetical protein TGVEG_267120 [Toxoplasma gondii VEG]PIM02098.1 hypothetical protein TGCOUG_267120 [Toxoplasma gondii COUG]|eukprot:XP_018636245.1 hypothetical protein TGME49_267120 [Toxoplasma gondii ME49]
MPRRFSSIDRLSLLCPVVAFSAREQEKTGKNSDESPPPFLLDRRRTSFVVYVPLVETSCSQDFCESSASSIFSSVQRNTRLPTMARRLGQILSDIFIIRPTGLTKVQSWITYASVTYLGYIWYADGRCPFLLSKEKSREAPLSEDAAQLVKDPAEERLIRELGVTTFREWKKCGFIPDSPARTTKDASTGEKTHG